MTTEGTTCIHPPGYDDNKEKLYPVLYLLHGYTDKEDGWINTGKAHYIIDNLLAEGKALPMIIVMPFGYVPPLPGDGEGEWEDWFSRVVLRYEPYLINELIPRVEQEYRVDFACFARNINSNVLE